MTTRSPFQVTVRAEPDGTPVSPRMRAGTLADRSARYVVDLLPAGTLGELGGESGSTTWLMTIPARAEASVSFRRARGEVVARLQALVSTRVHARAPVRRAAGDIPSVSAEAGGSATVVIDLPAADSWTLARTLRELSRLVDPRHWAEEGGAPEGALWRIDEDVPLTLSAKARIARLLSGSLDRVGSTLVLPARVDLDVYVSRRERVQAELRRVRGDALQVRVSSTDRLQAGAGADVSLGWRLRPARELGELLVDAVGPELAEAARRIHELLAEARRVQEFLADLPGEIRELGGRAIGPGSKLELLEIRLEEIAALLEALDDDHALAGWVEAVTALRARVGRLRRRAAAVVEKVARLAESIDPDDTLPQFISRLAAWAARLAGLEKVLADEAASVLADGLSVELAAEHRRTTERQVFAQAEVALASPAAREALACILGGHVAALAALGGTPGLRRLEGALVRSARKRRKRALRLRLGDAGIDLGSVWTGELRVTRSLDGAVEVFARERLERTRRRLLREDVAALLLDLALSQRSGALDPSLTLRWSQSWTGRRTRAATARMIERWIGAVTPGAVPPELPDGPGEALVLSRLDRAAIGGALRAGLSARAFADDWFWPAWASAIELGYRQVPPPLLRPGLHPLRNAALREILRRDPFAQAVGRALPAAPRLEREAIAADWRVGRDLLAALQRVREAATDPDQAWTAEAGARLGRRILSALRSVQTVDLVPLLALTLLVPEDLRRVDLRITPGTPGA